MSELPPCFIVETDLSYNADENSCARTIEIKQAIQLQNLLLRFCCNNVNIQFFVTEPRSIAETKPSSFFAHAREVHF
jgi:hypothetical protein